MQTSPIFCCRDFNVGQSLLTGEPVIVEKGSGSRDLYLPPPSTGPDPEAVRLLGRIYDFGPETLAERDKVNARLAKEGRPPIDLVATTREVEKIANDPALTDKEKRQRINEVRKRLGLSKGEMKRLFTKRLEKIYAEAVRRLEAVRGVNDPLVQRLKQRQQLYKSMYKPGGCIKKIFKGIGGFFKKSLQAIGKAVVGVFNPRNWFRLSFWRDVVAPIAMNFIPGLGPVVSTLYRWYRWGMTAYRSVRTISKIWKSHRQYRDNPIPTGLGAVPK